MEIIPAVIVFAVYIGLVFAISARARKDIRELKQEFGYKTTDTIHNQIKGE